MQASYILQVAICVLHIQRTFVDEGWFSVMVASQQVLLWMKLVSATQCLSGTKGQCLQTEGLRASQSSRRREAAHARCTGYRAMQVCINTQAVLGDVRIPSGHTRLYRSVCTILRLSKQTCHPSLKY